ncbi:MAG: glycosyltransferase [Ignavibacteriales bacterium]|nr:glycosyltransferase [Ignavibacteriales bacterium]
MTVTGVVVHFQTPDLLKTAVTSFRKFNPSVPLLIVDNGSDAASRRSVEALVQETDGQTMARYLPQNIYHGPAMHRALCDLETDLVFFFDSDTETERGGLLEAMEQKFAGDTTLYAAGKKDVVNARGFHADEGTVIVQTPSMMIRRSIYMQLPPFEHRGMPTLVNFAAAHRRGFGFADVPVAAYIRHDGRGTAGKFGYGLGLRGKIEFIIEKLTKKT